MFFHAPFPKSVQPILSYEIQKNDKNITKKINMLHNYPNYVLLKK